MKYIIDKTVTKFIIGLFAFGCLGILPALGQAWNSVPLDTLEDIAISLNTTIDSYGFVHVIYAASDSRTIKHAIKQGADWNFNEINIYTSFDNFFVDDDLDLHISISNYEALEYLFVSGTEPDLQIIDNSTPSYAGSDIYYDDGLEVICARYGPPGALLKFRYDGADWVRSQLFSISSYSALKSHVFRNNTHYAVISSDSPDSINYAVWDNNSYDIETLACDSISGAASLAIAIDGNPWVLFGLDGNHELNLVLAHKQDSAWFFEPLDPNFGTLMFKAIYSYHENKLYLLIRNSNHLLYFGSEGDTGWEFSPVSNQQVDMFDAAFDTNGWLHLCYITDEHAGYVVNYSYRQATDGVDDGDGLNIPERFILGNYPNPFNTTTTIRFSLVSAADYTVPIYDITGRLVDTITGSGPAGTNSVTWNMSGREAVSSGVYFYKIAAGSETVAGKMTYLK